MKFGGFNLGAWHESQSPADVLRHAVDEAVLADQLGFDTYWLGEHHFSRHGIFADTMVLASHIAARTERIGIGTAVIVLPLHNPIRVAEQVAMVDVLSGGRVHVGVGAGYQRREFEALGVPMEEARERYLEALDVLLRAWTDDTLVFEGRYTRVSVEQAIAVQPKPVQQPHPPLYQAVSITPESVRLAARRGLPVIVGGPTDVLGLAPQVIDLWRESMLACGRDPSGYDLPCLQIVYVAPSDAEAAEDMAGIDAEWSLRVLREVGSPIGEGGDVPAGYERWVGRWDQRQLESGRPVRSELPSLVGSPDTVAQRLRTVEEQGVHYILGRFAIPGLPREKVLRSMQLFGAEVMPRFRGA
jgi:alkanesulfonate monooxygenase SsuD/methylene tetrahydromethanopterin reductase-like flavin-dependent oxidoreductase (luciferase family)